MSTLERTTLSVVEDPSLPILQPREIPQQDPTRLSADLTATKAEGIVLEKFSAAFAKIKTTQSYGILDSFYFRMILPIKSLFTNLLEIETNDLELFNRQKALCTLVDRVKQAYEAYKSAAQVYSQATVAKIDAASLERSKQATVLIHRYQELISQATSDADRLTEAFFTKESMVPTRNIARTAVLKAVHTTLDQGNDGFIFHTINLEQARTYLQKGPAEELSKRYKDFVKDFATHVQQAALDSGHDITAIKNGFILGLASVTELADNMDIFSIFDLRNEGVEKHLNAEQEELVQDFLNKLNGCLNSPAPIDQKVLDNIQHKGISLGAILVNENHVAELIELKNTHGQWKELDQRRKGLEAQQTGVRDKIKLSRTNAEDKQKMIDAEVEYTVTDVAEFLKNIPRDKLEEFLKNTVNESYLLVKDLLELEREIAVKEEQANLEKDALTQAVKSAEDKARITSEELSHYMTSSVKALKTQIQKIEDQWDNDEKIIAENLRNLSSQKGYDLLITAALQGRENQKQKILNDLEVKKQLLQANEEGAAEYEQAAVNAEKALTDLKAEPEKPDSKRTREDLETLRAQSELLGKMTSIKMSGRQLLNLSKQFETQPTSSIGDHLKLVHQSTLDYQALTKVIHSLNIASTKLEKDAQETALAIEQIKHPLPSYVHLDADTQKMVLLPEFFNGYEGLMRTYLHNNLELEREVTRDVCQKIADRDNEVLKKMVEENRSKYPADIFRTLERTRSRFAENFDSVSHDLPAPKDVSEMLRARLRQLPPPSKEVVKEPIVYNLSDL